MNKITRLAAAFVLSGLLLAAPAAQAAPALLLRRGSGLTPYQNKFHRTWEAAA